ncbi:flagellar filament capping protein FliD [Brevibacillus migulae]|uniref:flagellar filament capping protein FliD n=1 Tax=Brevibacillus migulae TaxID=1644114 RepID=UPI00106E12FC|nr:flagellar filament capping protein FliD [Brevibacillus migulae]
MVSRIRFSGMASGLDTDSIVKELMNAQRIPMNKLIRKKQTEEWKRDAYREMNSLVLDLRKSIDSLRFAASFNKKIASSQNDSIVSAKVTGKPQMPSYEVRLEKAATAATPASVSFTSSLANSTTQVGAGNGFTFTLNSQNITVEETDTLDSIAAKVNDLSSTTGVKAAILDKQIVFTSTATGTSANVNIAATGTNVLNLATTSKTGTAADPGIVWINGAKLNVNSNTFNFDGMEFTTKQVTATPVTVYANSDTDAIFDNIKSFVDKYNETIEKINTKISEHKNKGYEPLLEEEKEALSDSQVEKMEAMAKSGLLLRDPILKSGLVELRRAISTPVSGADPLFDTLTEIGIGGPPSGKYAYMEQGKLYIDETKLRDAISKNGDKVVTLFTNYSASGNYNETGVAERLYDQLNKTIDELTKKAGSATAVADDSTLTKSINTITDDIERWEDRLTKIEDRYWKQFTAMEKAIQQSQSQGSWFAQMLGQ